MLKSTKSLWENSSPITIAASSALGVTLGICNLGTTVWFVILGLCLVLRTHILSLFIGLITGFFLSILLNGLYEPTGKMILLASETFWKRILSKPVICYLNLNVGKIMGNLFIAILSGLIIFIIVFVTLKYVLHKFNTKCLI